MKKSTLLLLTGVLICASIFCGCGAEDKTSENNKKNATVKTEVTNIPATEKVQETEKPVDIKKNTLYFSCKTNKKNTPGSIPANEAEGEQMDCFFVSGDYLFLDDTVGNRILVYKDFAYDHEIPLSENQDVQDMFYDAEKNVLKTVYENRNYTDATHYFYMEISVDDGNTTTDKEISNADKVLLEYYFDVYGNLNTDYYDDKSTEEVVSFLKILHKIFPSSYSWEYCYRNPDTGTSIYSIYDNVDGNDRTSILQVENGKATKYAVPMYWFVDGGSLKKIDGILYELVQSEDKIEIYMLAEKDFSKNKLKGYITEIE